MLTEHFSSNQLKERTASFSESWKCAMKDFFSCEAYLPSNIHCYFIYSITSLLPFPHLNTITLVNNSPFKKCVSRVIQGNSTHLPEKEKKEAKTVYLLHKHWWTYLYFNENIMFLWDNIISN